MGKKLRLSAVLGALLAVTLFLGGCAFSGSQKAPGMQRLIESARTNTDHVELAAYFEQEANTLQAKANEHEQMALAYGAPSPNGRFQRNDFIRHCNYLASKYREAAGENLALAKLHRRIAEQAQ